VVYLNAMLELRDDELELGEQSTAGGREAAMSASTLPSASFKLLAQQLQHSSGSRMLFHYSIH
jgi:hypothetical protein